MDVAWGAWARTDAQDDLGWTNGLWSEEQADRLRLRFFQNRKTAFVDGIGRKQNDLELNLKKNRGLSPRLLSTCSFFLPMSHWQRKPFVGPLCVFSPLSPNGRRRCRHRRRRSQMGANEKGQRLLLDPFGFLVFRFFLVGSAWFSSWFS